MEYIFFSVVYLCKTEIVSLVVLGKESICFACGGQLNLEDSSYSRQNLVIIDFLGCFFHISCFMLHSVTLLIMPVDCVLLSFVVTIYHTKTPLQITNREEKTDSRKSNIFITHTSVLLLVKPFYVAIPSFKEMID